MFYYNDQGRKTKSLSKETNFNYMYNLKLYKRYFLYKQKSKQNS